MVLKKCNCCGRVFQTAPFCRHCGPDMSAKSGAAIVPQVVVTRHPALVEYLILHGIIAPDTQALTHARVSDIRGKHVIGVLPLSYAAHAAAITEVPLNLTPDMRGRELSLAELEAVACEPQTYIINFLED